MAINHNAAVAQVVAPQDAELVKLGAQLNNTIQEMWPAHMTRRERRRWRRLEMERAAERLRAEGVAEPAQRPPRTRPGRRGGSADHTAPSPADTTPTAPLQLGHRARTAGAAQAAKSRY